MRERFELACKILGMMFICAGIMSSLSHLNGAFFAPDVSVDMKPVLDSLGQQFNSMPNQMAEAYKKTMKASHSSIVRFQYTSALFYCIVPLAMGLMLMRSNNIFVRLAYPNAELPLKSASYPDSQTPPQVDNDTRPGEDLRYAPRDSQ